MSRPRLPGLALGAALGAAGCRGRGDDADRAPTPPAAPRDAAAATAPAPTPPTPPPLPPTPIEVLSRDGATQLTLTMHDSACGGAAPGISVTASRNGADTALVTSAGAGDSPAPDLTLERTPAGDQLSRGGARLLRLWRDPAHPGHVDVVAPDGLAQLRYDATAGSAIITDAAGAPATTVVAEGGRFVVRDHRDAVLGYVRGGDADLAALLSSPLPADARLAFACDRLLSMATVHP